MNLHYEPTHEISHSFDEILIYNTHKITFHVITLDPNSGRIVCVVSYHPPDLLVM